jgi:hypothetical protein
VAQAVEHLLSKQSPEFKHQYCERKKGGREGGREGDSGTQQAFIQVFCEPASPVFCGAIVLNVSRMIFLSAS